MVFTMCKQFSTFQMKMYIIDGLFNAFTPDNIQTDRNCHPKTR